jgi:glycosyltransferase involved in cell wall biosynthesis
MAQSRILVRLHPDCRMARILHIIDTLSGAGPTRSLRAAVQFLAQAGHHHDHEVVTLGRRNYPPALVRARQAGITIHQAPAPVDVARLIEAADLVELHYWHTPAFVDFLAQRWPPHRRLAWFKILGRHAPQVISPDLLAVLDAVMVSSTLSLELPALQQATQLDGMIAFVPGLMEPDRLDGLAPQPHDGFIVTYIGTVNPTKMHPEFVTMSAAAHMPDVRFVVCGAADAALRAEADKQGSAGHFEFRGYVENIRAVLAVTDVFGYPLCEDTWGTSEKSLQEAMLAGIPPVVFPHGGVADMVEHGHTGLVVHSPREYADALEYLYLRPDERKRLGDNARTFVQQRFDGRQAVGRMESLHQRLLARPRREIPPLHADLATSARFARHMLPSAPQFEDSLRVADDRPNFPADAAVAASSTTAAQGEGGIVQFRNAAPDDPVMLLWSGLVLAGRERWEAALLEFERAAASQPQHFRPAWYRALAHVHVHGHAAAEPLIAEALTLADRAGMCRAARERLTEAAGHHTPRLFPT